MKIVLTCAVLTALFIYGCGDKSKAAADQLGKSTVTFVSTAAGEAMATAKVKAAEAAEAAAEALKK